MAKSVEAPAPLKERLDARFEKADHHLKNKTNPEEELLTKGYELFFDTIEPVKDTRWINAENPHSWPKVWLTAGWENRLGDFADLFAPHCAAWGVDVYNLRKGSLSTERDVSLRIMSGEQGTHGEKKIHIFLTTPTENYRSPYGQMRIEDTDAGWLRSGRSGTLEVAPDKSLFSYPGLAVVKLAVASVEAFVTKLQ